RAVLSGSGGSSSGISLQSVGYGASEFVTVQVVNSGGINTEVAEAGIYRFETHNTGVASTAPADRVLFNAANNRTTDLGQNVDATINGIQATTLGTVARINTDFLDVEVELKT